MYSNHMIMKYMYNNNHVGINGVFVQYIEYNNVIVYCIEHVTVL